MVLIIVTGLLFASVVTIWSLWGYPIWRVWNQGKQGEADLMQAHREQQIQVSRAQGRLDAAELNKKAAVIEAEAVSKQIEVIGAQLTKHDLYLKWQWIKMMEDHQSDALIYIPTEANIPILEAGRTLKSPGETQ